MRQATTCTFCFGIPPYDGLYIPVTSRTTSLWRKARIMRIRATEKEPEVELPTRVTRPAIGQPLALRRTKPMRSAGGWATQRPLHAGFVHWQTCAQTNPFFVHFSRCLSGTECASATDPLPPSPEISSEQDKQERSLFFSPTWHPLVYSPRHAAPGWNFCETEWPVNLFW